MKIGIMISRLGSGGAERQVMRLASGLASRGHTVEVLCYGGPSKLDEQLTRSGVAVRTGAREGWMAKLHTTRRWLRDFRPDVVHGFMKRASTLAVLARGRHDCGVIASDLSTAAYARHRPSLWPSLVAFGFADRTATQTELNRRSLEALAPWLRGRTVVVRNGVDTEHFSPGPRRNPGEVFRFCAVGTVYDVKNPVRVVRAVAELRHQSAVPFRLDWYGRLGFAGDHAPSPAYVEACKTASELGVSDCIAFHGETADVLSAYRAADALIHASVQEGFPNAVVEGMACGLPLVVSRVSDLPLIVAEAQNGFVFDETDPSAMASAMQGLLELDAETRSAMAVRSRALATKWFGLGRFIDEYETLYGELAR